MKIKTILLATSISVLSFLSVAEDEIESSIAPQIAISEALLICQEDAVNEEVDKESLNSYLLECVNDELVQNDYAPLASLPKLEEN